MTLTRGTHRHTPSPCGGLPTAALTCVHVCGEWGWGVGGNALLKDPFTTFVFSVSRCVKALTPPPPRPQAPKEGQTRGSHPQSVCPMPCIPPAYHCPYVLAPASFFVSQPALPKRLCLNQNGSLLQRSLSLPCRPPS